MPKLILPLQALSIDDIFWESGKDAEELKKQYYSKLNAYSLLGLLKPNKVLGQN